MAQTDVVIALVVACLIIVFLILIIRKWEKVAKKALRDSNKPITLNESFVGCHFFIHGFYPKKQSPGTYEDAWLVEARIEGKEGVPVLKITDQQAGALVEHPNKMFVLEKDSDKLSFRLVLDENELFLRLRHKE
jgi:hypothetical protein